MGLPRFDRELSEAELQRLNAQAHQVEERSAGNAEKLLGWNG